MRKSTKTAAGTASLSLFRTTRREAVWLILFGLGSFGLALYFRYGVIQNTPLRLACDAGDANFICGLRTATIQLFMRDVFGVIALALALFQVLRPNIVAFASGLVITALGLVLYNTRLSALAAALLVLSLARTVREAR